MRDSRRRVPYESIVLPADPRILARVRGKIAVVGVEVASEVFDAAVEGGQRYGFELQADAINTLLQNTVIRPLSNGPQFVLILVLSLSGWLVWYLRPSGRVVRWILILAVIVSYMAFGVWSFAKYAVVFDLVFPLAALFLSYLLVKRFTPAPVLT
jgi:CHASE2 domain-containing sensor protein